MTNLDGYEAIKRSYGGGISANRHDPAPISLELLTLDAWLGRDLPEPDFLLGEVLSTTSRLEWIGPTGIGKSNILLALAIAIADGRDFLHWRGSGRPRGVLYIDGEMNRRVAKKRLSDAARRHGSRPSTFFYLSREDYSSLEPLNCEAGQKFVDEVIDQIGTVDLIIFDNIQAILRGEMKEEEAWEQTLPWVRDLTRRSVGQLWVHHTGHDESRGYGTKTREWQFDTVALMGWEERPDADIAFSLRFLKARERTPENRADFDDAVIILSGDEWASERGGRSKKPVARDRALQLLNDAVARHGFTPPTSEYISPNTLVVTLAHWRKACDLGCISEGDQDARNKAFNRAAKGLLEKQLIGKHGEFVWPV
jgi:hypothetical protein